MTKCGICGRELRQEMLGKTHALVNGTCSPSCPFCGDGLWVMTSTAGRLECDKCGAIALVGRSEVVKIGG